MEIIQVFRDEYDEEESILMAKYMRNKFTFLGIKNPKRKILQKDFVSKNKDHIDWSIVKKLLKEEEREFYYLALDYLKERKAILKIEDFEKIQFLICYKSWWDSVDTISPLLVAQLVSTFPQLKDKVIEWSKTDNIWLQRSALIYQLKYKEDLDKEILVKVIDNTKNTKDFFVEKAIGWILREYSKVNKLWVKDFINNNYLPPLSKLEGSKYI